MRIAKPLLRRFISIACFIAAPLLIFSAFPEEKILELLYARLTALAGLSLFLLWEYKKIPLHASYSGAVISFFGSSGLFAFSLLLSRMCPSAAPSAPFIALLQKTPILQTALLILAGAALEELYFRVWLFELLPSSPVWAALISTLFFAFLHVRGWGASGALFALAAGAFFSYLRVRERSALLPFLCHAALNFAEVMGQSLSPA